MKTTLKRRAYLKKWRKANKDHVKAYHKEHDKLYRLKNKERLAAYNKEWRKLHPWKSRVFTKKALLKVKARKLLYYAIKSGKMVRGNCEIKNCKIRAEAHHEDYSKPLVVRWFCKRHHFNHHYEN